MGFLPMLILHLLIVGYLLSWRQKSSATWLLIGWQSCLLLLIVSLFAARTVYNPLSVYLEWMGGTTFAMLGTVFMIQFAYHFPRPFYPREARVLLIISSLVWLGLVGLMVIEAKTAPGVLNYHFEGFLYGFLIPPGEKQGLASFDIFDLLHPLAFIWTLLIWLRQSVRLSRAEEHPNQPGWWQLLNRPRGQAAVATRNFALLFVAALLTVVISTLEARSYLPDGSFATAYLLAWFAWILVYVNSAPEATSFMARLVGISLVTLLVIVGLANPLLLTWYDQAYEQARQTELAYLQRLISRNDVSRPPEPVEYLLVRPATGGPFATDYRLLFSRRAGLTAQDFVQSDARVQEALEQGVQQSLLREHPWLNPEQLGAEEDLTQTTIPARTRLYRGALATAEFHFIRYAIRQDETLYEVGYSYPAYRLALHRQAAPLAWLTGAAVLAILVVFPYFFRQNLVRPLENLLHGVKQVNEGDLTVAVPVSRQDEIGFLTHSFNHMVQSLLLLNTNLHQEIAEHKHTEASLRESEARFRRVITSISDHIYMTEFDSEGQPRNLYISPNVEQLTGFPRARFVDDWHFWPSTVIHPDDRPAAVAHAAGLVGGQAGEIEYRLVRADGRIIWVRDRSRVERQGDRIIVYGLVGDISERKQAEAERERLHRTEREQRLLAEALNQAGAAINSSLNYEEVLDLILEQINLLVPHDTANIMLIQNQTARLLRQHGHRPEKPSAYPVAHSFPLHEFPGLLQMQETGRPLILPEVENSPEWQPTPETAWIKSYLGVPLSIHNRVVGFLNVNSAVPGFFSQSDADRLQGLANQAATAIENARLFEATRQASARLAEAEEIERQRLARELHDQVGQNLTALSLNLTTMRTYLSDQVPETEEFEQTREQLSLRLEDSRELVKETTARIRSVMDDLRSPVLEEYGLSAALRWYGKQFSARSGIAITLQGEALSIRPPAAVENTFFRIAQEALTNAAKHAQASQITMKLAVEDGLLRLVIADNGRGFNPDDDSAATGKRRRGLGLLTIAERAEAVGGRCRIQTSPEAGTLVIVEVKL